MKTVAREVEAIVRTTMKEVTTSMFPSVLPGEKMKAAEIGRPPNIEMVVAAAMLAAEAAPALRKEATYQ